MPTTRRTGRPSYHRRDERIRSRPRRDKELVARPFFIHSRYFGQRLTDRQEADDLAQQVFEELTHGPTPENPRAYFRAVARNVLARHLRRKEKELRVLRELSQLAAPDPLYVEGPSETEREDVLKDMAAALAPERMDLLKWRYLEELSIEEIADRLGCSEPAVHKRLQRIIQFLRRRYHVDE